MEGHKDRPTSSKALPDCSRPCLPRGTDKVVGRDQLPQLLSDKGGEPHHGHPSPWRLPAGRSQKKVHLDVLSPSKCPPQLKPSPGEGRRARPWHAGRPGPFFPSSEHPSAKECVTCVWRKPSPWEVAQVGGKVHPWGQSEGGGELPPGTLRGEARWSSSDHRCWPNGKPPASPRSACLSPQQPKGTHAHNCSSPTDRVPFRKKHEKL